MPSYLLAILTLIIGSYLTYIYEERKHKKSDYRLTFTISRIDKIREWGEYLESELYKEKFEIEENKIEKLFYIARSICIRFDRRFKTDWLSKIDNIHPLVLDLFNEQRSNNIEDILGLLSPFLDEIEYWRFKLYSDPFPLRYKLFFWRILSKCKKKCRVLFGIILLILFIIFSSFLFKFPLQFFKNSEIEKHKKLAYSEIVEFLKVDNPIIKNDSNIFSLLVDNLSNEPDFFKLISNHKKMNKRNVGKKNIISQEAEKKFYDKKQQNIEEENEIILLNSFISNLKDIKQRLEDSSLIEEEERFIGNIKIKSKIDDTINNLEKIMNRLEKYSNNCFNKSILELDQILSQMKTELENLYKNGEITNKIEECYKRTKLLNQKFSTETERAKNKDPEKKSILFKILLDLSNKKYVLLLEEIVNNKDIPISIKANAIDEIGEIGDLENLKALIELTRNDSTIVKNKAIIAIVKILYEKDNKNWKEFWNSK